MKTFKVKLIVDFINFGDKPESSWVKFELVLDKVIGYHGETFDGHEVTRVLTVGPAHQVLTVFEAVAKFKARLPV